MLSGSIGSAVFIGGEDLTDEVKILSDRADFTGTYSYIFKGTCRSKEVAIKVLKLVSKNLNTTKRKFRREFAVWKHVNHPNISPFYGYTEGNGVFGPVGALISPWYNNGDAETFLQEKGKSLSTEERVDLWRGVVSGVCYLHEQDPKIAHGDLKPSNILIDESGSPRICDFGLSCIYLEEGHTELTTTSPHTGTERYLAPELLDDDAQPSTASDMWALGCIGLQFLYCMVPYQHRKSNRSGLIFQDIRQGVLPAPLLTHNDAKLTPFSQILIRCWSWLSGERIDAPNALFLLNRIGGREVPNPLKIVYEDISHVPENILTTGMAANPPIVRTLPLSSGMRNEISSSFMLDHPGPTEIVLNPNGTVRAATLPALIERLTMHSNMEAGFNDTFMMTFKSFSNIGQVFDLLIERYNIQPPESLAQDQVTEWTEKRKMPIQLRTMNTMHTLINMVEREDLHILDRVKTFANDVISNHRYGVGFATSLLHSALQVASVLSTATLSAIKRGNLLEERNGIEAKQTMPILLPGPPPPPIRPRAMGFITLLDIDPLELARQLTIIESELFLKVKQSDYIAYSKELLPMGLENIKSIITMNNKVNGWVTHAVLSKEHPKQRAAVIKHFIDVASRCRDLANYSSSAAILTGLTSPILRRLRDTWKQVDVSEMEILTMLEGVIDAKHGFQGYKERIPTLQPPCIPFLRAHLAIITSIQNSGGYHLDGSALIDFQKCQDMADAVAGITNLRVWGYKLTQLLSVRRFIDESLGALDNMPDLAQLSIQRE